MATIEASRPAQLAAVRADRKFWWIGHEMDEIEAASLQRDADLIDEVKWMRRLFTGFLVSLSIALVGGSLTVLFHH